VRPFADADSGKAGFELALRPGPPAHHLPFGSGQHVFGRHRLSDQQTASRLAVKLNGVEKSIIFAVVADRRA
jgi:hypothetical protein